MLKQQYRYITRVDGVRSGRAIVADSRIGVHDVVALILNDSSIDDVIRSYPSLTRAQVYESMAYYEDHKSKIDFLIAQQMAEVE